MKGLFIPEITSEMFRNGCLESIEALMAEGYIYDIEYSSWLPCEERLPEKEGQYLVTLDFEWGKKIEMDDWVIFEDGNGEWVNHNSHVTVAWMELPEPWNERSGTNIRDRQAEEMLQEVEDENDL